MHIFKRSHGLVMAARLTWDLEAWDESSCCFMIPLHVNKIRPVGNQGVYMAYYGLIYDAGL